jgi:hypothetical protein
MAFIPLKDFLSIWHFKLIGLISLRAVSERVKKKQTLAVTQLSNAQHLNLLSTHLSSC